MALSNNKIVEAARRLWEDARRNVAAAPIKPDPAGWDENRITISWLGHASTLINFYGIHILTDPVLENRVGFSTPFGTLGVKRLVAPALKPAELPRVDVVLLSHGHYDHMDTPTLAKVGSDAWVATAWSTRDLLARYFKNINELKWGEKATFRNGKGELTVEAVEVKHWGERYPSKIARGYNGYLIHREGKSLLFGGDTAMTPTLGAAKSKGPFEAAIMPIGAYQPWIWVHCNPEEALQMSNAAGAKYILPVHHQTFKLSDEPTLEPIYRLKAALNGEQERLGWNWIGETFVVPTL